MHDMVADALYIRLRDDKVMESSKIILGVIADFNVKGEILEVIKVLRVGVL